VTAARPSLPQALVLADSHRGAVRHLLGHVQAKGGLRNFLHGLRGLCDITWDAPSLRRGECHVALGLTYAGLLSLPVPRHVRQVLHRRAPAFCDGAALRAPARLGDTGINAPSHWSEAFGPTLHFILTMHADSPNDLDRQTKAVEALRDRGNPVRLHVLEGGWIGAPPGQQGQWVHFGYRDGLSHVRLDHPAGSRSGGVAAGEVLLGHPRDHGDNPWLLARQRSRLLRELFLDGSFGVLRKIEQDTAAFEDYVDTAAQRLRQAWPQAAAQPALLRDLVKAKLCGRWPDGRAFDPQAGGLLPAGSAQHPPEQLQFQDDAAGEACPFAAHVRRLQSGGADLAHARRRVLVRRGRPYGKAAWHPVDGQVERGLLGLFFCASLEDQFEHLLGHWVDAMPLGLPGDRQIKDPLIGHHDDGGAPFEVPLPGQAPLPLPRMPRCVRTRGTAYAFYPGQRGLQLLLEEHDLLDRDEEEPLP
jgi:deferrochelatase/peroxidase EfeB